MIREVIQAIRARLTARRDARANLRYRIRCTPEALMIEPARGEGVVVPWGTIARVAAFKRDCYVIDSIRLLVATADGRGYECSEDDEGFDEAVQPLPCHLAGCVAFTDWFATVAFPAFETNFTQIYPPPTA